MNDQPIETTMNWSPFWPWELTIIIAAISIALVAWCYRKEARFVPVAVLLVLCGLRVCLILMVLLMLQGPNQVPYRTDLPDLLVVLDDSASMATVDQSGAERLELGTKWFLQSEAAIIRRLQETYRLKWISLHHGGLRTEPDQIKRVTDWLNGLSADGPTSPLGLTLRQALLQQRGRSLAAVVVFTDGITTEGPTLGEVAMEFRQRNIPLYVVSLGNPRPSLDVGLDELIFDDVIQLGDTITIDMRVHGQELPVREAQVQLKRLDNDQTVAQQMIKFKSATESQQVRLAFRPESIGTIPLRIQVTRLDKESNISNNELTCQVEVRDETLRVFFVQAYPSYEFRYLKTLLERRRDLATGENRHPVELKVLLQESDPELDNIDTTIVRNFPDRDELFEFDVVLFGDVNPRLLGREAMSNLRDFVMERGHGMIAIAGSRFFPHQYAESPIAPLLPGEFHADPSVTSTASGETTESGYHVQPSQLAERFSFTQLDTDRERNAAIWRELPVLYWQADFTALKPGVRVLLESSLRDDGGKPQPLVTIAFVGSGNVLFHAMDESWRWRIERGDEIFGQYWFQAIRYLSRFKLGAEKRIEFTSDREGYQQGDVVRFQVRFFDDRLAPDDDTGVEVVLHEPTQGERRLALSREGDIRGRFHGEIAELPIGRYHAWIAEPTTMEQAPSTDFEIRPYEAESVRSRPDDTEMRRASELSGGAYFTSATIERLESQLPRGTPIRVGNLPAIPLWNRWPLAFVFVLLLVSEWMLRRRFGRM